MYFLQKLEVLDWSQMMATCLQSAKDFGFENAI
jgi:hypothetical protein